MTDSVLFIGAVVVALTDVAKSLSPKVTGAVTVLVAGFLGALIALVDVQIGVVDITVAEGIMTGLAAAGAVGVAKRVG